MAPALAIPGPASLRLLSRRERVVLTLVGECLTDAEIAEKLARETTTIRTHLRRVYRKLGTSRRCVLVRLAVRAGLVEV